MEANEETYRLFDNYLSGNLSEEEKGAFEKNLSENDSLRQEFLWMSSAVNTIRMSGKQIFKKQIAEIGMGIPGSAFEKYSPSIKPKSFFRKYWWAITTAAALAVAAGGWFVYNHHKNVEYEKDVAPVLMDSVEKKDSVVVPKKDSCATDSAKGEQPQYDQAQLDKLSKAPSIEDCISQSMPVFARYSFLESRPDSLIIKNKGEDSKIISTITVTLCFQNSQPAFYSYSGTELRIYGPYTSFSKIVFCDNSGGGTLMTDGKSGFFVLKKDAQQSLVRQFNGKDAGVKLWSPPARVDSVGKVEKGVMKNTIHKSASR